VSTATDLNLQTGAVLGLKPGEKVRVRSASEIFATLDEHGAYDELPFMPEMVKYCGRTLTVTQRADTTCAGTGLVRRMHDTVHLQRIRCDGAFHDGCQAGCLMFWKEAWLERAEPNGERPAPEPLTPEDEAYVEETLLAGVRKPAEDADAEPLWRCQATEIPKASQHMRFREIDQYKRGLDNWKWPKIVRGVVLQLFNFYQSFTKNRLPKALLIKSGNPYPFIVGKAEKGKTPKITLDVQPGDLVRIKSKEEIEATIDETSRNRGLTFDPEMAMYCGRTARVQARITHLIEERTGEMLDIKSDCIVLEGVVCASDYHRFCTRAIYTYWREAWLEKLEPGTEAPIDAPKCVTRWSRV
jgi:hypothetical protein